MVVPPTFRIKQSKETLKMKALSFFEVSATTFQSKRSYIPGEMNLQESDNGKLKSHKLWVTENNRNILTR
jgi:serine/threonine-protein kinase RIO1